MFSSVKSCFSIYDACLFWKTVRKWYLQFRVLTFAADFLAGISEFREFFQSRKSRKLVLRKISEHKVDLETLAVNVLKEVTDLSGYKLLIYILLVAITFAFNSIYQS